MQQKKATLQEKLEYIAWCIITNKTSSHLPAWGNLNFFWTILFLCLLYRTYFFGVLKAYIHFSSFLSPFLLPSFPPPSPLYLSFLPSFLPYNLLKEIHIPGIMLDPEERMVCECKYDPCPQAFEVWCGWRSEGGEVKALSLDTQWHTTPFLPPPL